MVHARNSCKMCAPSCFDYFPHRGSLSKPVRYPSHSLRPFLIVRLQLDLVWHVLRHQHQLSTASRAHGLDGTEINMRTSYYTVIASEGGDAAARRCLGWLCAKVD
jgi:hypothetical protein